MFRIKSKELVELSHTHQASRMWTERSLRIARKQNIDRGISREKAEHRKKQTGKDVLNIDHQLGPTI